MYKNTRKMELQELTGRARKEASAAHSLNELDAVYKLYLGRKGTLTQILRSLKTLSEDERKKQGAAANVVREELEEIFAERRLVLAQQEFSEKEQNEWLDVTAPGKRVQVGHVHPLTTARHSVIDIFQNMGFEVATGPHVETEQYNFDMLNIPANHPARDLWDTFWLKNLNLLLRTHTSPVQARYMEAHQPPLRIIAPGLCFRHEATDASHGFQFYQIEGLMVDTDITAANFKAIIEEFLTSFFEQKMKTRLRPSYFPFTEPSFEVDISCVNCQSKGCSVCSQTGWLEAMGAGMVNPAVFKAVGYNPKKWQGFAFGLGLDRFVMLKHNISDIRELYRADLKFTRQF